jgi:2Fe-2S ferredoxin
MSSESAIQINVTDRDGVVTLITSNPSQKNLMQLLYDNDMDIEASCGGCASCATCHVFIDSDWHSKLPERDSIEDTLLEFQEHFDPESSRLSCQVLLNESMDGLSLRIAPEE